MKIKESDFNAGSPYSSWLKEKLIGECADYMNGYSKGKLLKKYGIKVYKGISSLIMNTANFSDYPENFQKMAEEIIQKELDPSFKITN